MHLFFDTVWKLHIGEIPEKPKKEDHATYLSYYPELFKYNEAIAAIKQNALTVGNAEILKQFGYLELPINGDFVKWPGGYETKCEHPCMCTIRMQDGLDYNYNCKEFAILTLPEEKKNTMENMTEKDLAIKMANRALEVPYADPDSDICTISRQFLRLIELTASGSVAAQKEEGNTEPYFHLSKNEYGKMWLMYKPEGNGRYKCWEPITEEFWNEFEKLLR